MEPDKHRMPTRRQALALGAGMLATLARCGGSASEGNGAQDPAPSGYRHGVSDVIINDTLIPSEVEPILAGMSLDEKISQLIIPAIARGATNLDDHPELAEALRRHQFGGVILFGSNIEGTEQTLRLTDALQDNNLNAEASTHIPYLVCADGEGGVVLRLDMGTRMTGAMAVGATGASAQENARETGAILGRELSVLGINVDFAPVADVNSNPANPVIGVRSFGDDPAMVAELASAMAKGVSSSGAVPCFKHFPGHGDTGTDSHLGTATVEKSLEELRACELVPFAAAVKAGADLIMTAHITCPEIDEEVALPDGSTGCYPATMSHTIITKILREELGYDGAVITDALNMDAIASANLVEGSPDTAQHAANIAEKVLNAGVDILLQPHGLSDSWDAAFYDEYVDLICQKVEEGAIDLERIDQSVRRVLTLKESHGILGLYDCERDTEARTASAQEIIGSSKHHEAEMRMAREAITVVKNEGALPLVSSGSYVLLVRTPEESSAAEYALSQLEERGLFGGGVLVRNLITGGECGSDDASARVTIDRYYDLDAGEIRYSDALSSAIAEASAVICETTTWSTSVLSEGSAQRTAIERAMDEAHGAGAAFIQLSDNLPYDVACYTDADAQVIAYMSEGSDIDPTDRSHGSDAPAYNANFTAALEAIFGGFSPTGTLPVDIPVIEAGSDGAANFTGEILYERGLGLSF